MRNTLAARKKNLSPRPLTLWDELTLAEARPRPRLPRPPAPRRLRYTAFSKSAGEDTDYVVELFDVELLPDAAERVGLDAANAWVTAEEIRAGRRGADGRAVSATVRELLDRLGWAG